MSNKQLLTRSIVYILVFTLFSISYVHYTNELEKENENKNPLTMETTVKAVEPVEYDDEDEKVLGDLDINSFKEILPEYIEK